MTGHRPDVPERRPTGVPGMLLLAHFAIALLFVLDFILFQAAATATTVAIYSIIPMLDDSIVRGGPSWTWIRIFQIVSPTITLPGGIVTVLSSYYFARRAQEETRRAEAEAQKAEAEAQKAQHEAQRADAETQRADAETQKAQQETERADAEAQKAQQEAQRADAEAQKAQQEALLRQAAEAEVQALKAQLAQAPTPPRSRRRRLRNGNGAAPP